MSKLYNEPRYTIEFAGNNRQLFAAIRRVILADIPTYTMGNIKVHTNTSDLEDEMFIDGLSLLKLRQDLLVSPEKARFNLKVTNKIDGILPIFADDFLKITPTPKAFPLPKRLLIAALRRGQMVDISGTFILGTAAKHQRHACVPDVAMTHSVGKSAKFSIGTLNVYDPKDILKTSIRHLLQIYRDFPAKSRTGRSIKTTKTIGFPIATEIINAGGIANVVEDHPLIPSVTLNILSENPDKWAKSACGKIIIKLKSYLKQIK